MRRVPVYLLTLDCGHTAAASADEEHMLGRRRPCHACSSTDQPPYTWCIIERVQKLHCTLPDDEQQSAA